VEWIHPTLLAGGEIEPILKLEELTFGKKNDTASFQARL
jgi:hypothetical protein